MMINKKTKIVATIGPASDSLSKIKEMIGAGVDVFRFNTKYSIVEWHNERIKRVQKIARQAKKNIGIMIDLQGSEIRIETKDGKSIVVRKNDIIRIKSTSSFKEALVAIPDQNVFNKLKKGNNILIDDGSIELRIVKKRSDIIEAKVVHGGIIENRKSVNFPGANIKFSSLIKRDLDNLDSVARNKVDFVALSFVSSSDDIKILKEEMKKRKMGALIVAKIENQNAINNIDEIINESDAIMIARGDLGIEIPIEQLAFWQKKIIKKCRAESKPVIVATQMLYSMIKNPRPTRAEVTDVANAVLDGTDAVMLSGETAIGDYPIKSVIEMAKILKFNEKNSVFSHIKNRSSSPTKFIVGSIIKGLEENKLKIKAVVVFTERGYTARIISALRPKINILAITNNKDISERLSLSYGVDCFHTMIDFSNLKIPKNVADNVKRVAGLKEGDIVAVFHGQYKKNPNLLNLFSLTKI